MPSKIPATVVTGFLGAGKTTLIRHLLANANGAKIALIINEFGDVGVDGDVLGETAKGCGDQSCADISADDDIVELSNGCLCCTVAEDFVPTMKKLVERDNPPDHIVIETSGLALPQPLVRAFNWPEIRTKVTVDGVVTVVDAAAVAEGRFAQDQSAIEAIRQLDQSIDHETPLGELFEDQLNCADLVIVNKTDLLTPEQADAVVAEMGRSTRPTVQVTPTRHGVLPLTVLLGLDVGAEDDLAARRSHHEAHHADHHDDHHDHDHDHDHDAFESFVVSLPPIDDVDAFSNRLTDAMRAHDILRLKGFAAVEGKPMRLVLQAVGPRLETYFDRPFAPGEDRSTRLVVIGQTGLDRAAIEERLGAMAFA